MNTPADLQTGPRDELLYDLAATGWPDALWLFGAVMALLLAGVSLWWAKRRGRPTVLPGFLVVAALVALAATGLNLWDHQRLVKALHSEQALLVEGIVQSHSVTESSTYNGLNKRRDRRTWESFYVGSVAFGFDRRAPRAGFSNHGAEPITLADGQRLRVQYVEDTPGDYATRRILRLHRVLAN